MLSPFFKFWILVKVRVRVPNPNPNLEGKWLTWILFLFWSYCSCLWELKLLAMALHVVNVVVFLWCTVKQICDVRQIVKSFCLRHSESRENENEWENTGIVHYTKRFWIHGRMQWTHCVDVNSPQPADKLQCISLFCSSSCWLILLWRLFLFLLWLEF